MAEDKGAGHPLDRQNAIERDIQLNGPKDPDHFKMPDGRTLSEVREANDETQSAEYQEEIQMLANRTREQSITGLQKGGKLVMTKPGNLIDITEPETSDTPAVTMATSRTTAAEIEAGVIQPRRESGSATNSGETSSSSGTPSGVNSTTTAPDTDSSTS
jgi:hypothetical protein